MELLSNNLKPGSQGQNKFKGENHEKSFLCQRFKSDDSLLARSYNDEFHATARFCRFIWGD